jgi:hypothetical protein
MMPAGRPVRPFSPIVGKPVAEVVHRDRWQAAEAPPTGRDGA